MSSPNLLNKALYSEYEDCRTPLYNLKSLNPNPDFLSKVQEQAKSVACLIHRIYIDKLEDGSYWLRLSNDRKLSAVQPRRHKESHNEEIPLADDERFRDEYSIGEGTAFLFAPQYILTAAHCFFGKSTLSPDSRRINEMQVVFGFERQSETEVKQVYANEDVYGVQTISLYKYNRENTWEDWAIVKLDRPVTGRSPLLIETKKESRQGEWVYMLGHPLGMPITLTQSAKVTQSKDSQFQADLDAFAGNSGSPVFSYEGQAMVHGILCQGQDDYGVVETREGKKLRSLKITQQMSETFGHEKIQKLNMIPVFEIFDAMKRSPNMEPSLRETAICAPLLNVYRKQGYLTRFLNKTPFPIEESYINVTLVDRKTGEEDKDHTKPNPDGSPFLEKRVELSQLFDLDTKLFFEGAAGSGKTTLCRYLVYTWANLSPEKRQETLGSWANRYDSVIFLRLREIRSLSIDSDLNKLIATSYPTLSHDIIDKDKTLYILDGFDEIASLEKICKENTHDKRWQIVENVLEKPHWIITSRPNLYSEKFFRCRYLQNNGFTKENVSAYIKRFCKEFKIESQELERVISSQNELQVLARNPLYLELVCSLWKENRSLLYPLNNLSSLYDKIAALLFRRHLMRLGVNTTGLFPKDVLTHEKVSPYREYLEEIAFRSKQSGGNRIVPDLYQPVLEKIPTGEREAFGDCLFDQLGLLTPVSDAKELLEQNYAFIHPTFEEYFAARFVVSRLNSSERLIENRSAEDWLADNCFLIHFEKLLDFTLSLTVLETPLKKLAKLLLTHGKEKPNEWRYPLHRASELGLSKLAKFFMENGVEISSLDNRGKHPIFRAVKYGHKEVVELLISKGANIHHADESGEHLLHLASLEGHKEVVELLINNRANIRDVNYSGKQPIHLAAEEGHKEVVELLISKGAYILDADKSGKQPLHLAAEEGHKEVVELLISKGANIHDADKSGKQPLHLSAMNGHKEVVELLISKGANIEAADKIRNQPLHWASQYRHTEVVELLLRESQMFDTATDLCKLLLLRAATNGHTEIVDFLINKGANLNSSFSDGRQPLHWASRNGHKGIVELLLVKEAMVDAADSDGMQPILWAAMYNHKEIVELLINKGAKVNAADNHGMHPLNWASRNGNKEIIELLINKGAKVDAADNDGMHPLHWASRKGHKEVVELLLDKKAKVDAADKGGMQPILEAAIYNHKELVELLISKGAKVDAADNDGMHPLHWASRKGHKEVVELLLLKGAKVDGADKDGWQALHLAAQKGHKEVIELLLLKGAKVDAADKDGWQPLHSAAQNGHKEVVELLLQKGAKVDAATIDGWQPLHPAAEYGHREVVELLLLKGAKVDVADNDSWQPLHSAANNGNTEVIKLLLSKGAKVDATTNSGWQAVHFATQNGSVNCLEFLIEKGAKVDATDEDGTQPIHVAAYHGKIECITKLLERGAMIDAADNEGQAIHFAALNGHKEVVRLLLEKGAKVDAVDKDGKKAIERARENGHEEVVQLLLDEAIKSS